ncbi:MAG: ATP-binding protein [Mariprofundales bacterium]
MFKMIAALPFPLLYIAANGKVIDANITAQDVLLLSNRHLQQRFLQTIFAPEEEVGLLIKRCVQVGADIAAHGLQQLANPKNFFSLYASAIALDVDKKHAILVLLAPEMGRRSIEQQSRRYELAETVSRIALEMAHEIKNPLAGLRGAAQWLSEQSQTPDCLEAIHMILSEVDRIKTRIDNFLQLAPRAQVGMELINIHTVIDEVCNSYYNEQHNVQINTNPVINLKKIYDPSLPMISVHRSRFRQAIENLWRNAIEADASYIEWKTGIATNEQLLHSSSVILAISITNDGQTVPKELRNHLFEPFVTGKKRGSGLGLAIVQRVMQEHHGRVSVKCEEGHTRMVLHLPISPIVKK